MSFMTYNIRNGSTIHMHSRAISYSFTSTDTRILSNKKYLGTKYYPAIIDREIYNMVQEERHRRAVALGRVHDETLSEPPALKAPPAPLGFWKRPLEIKFQDPYKQAEFAYSLIEREMS